MSKVVPITKWFLRFDKNILETKYVNHLPEEKIGFRLFHKNAFLVTGEFPEEKYLKDVIVEAWTSPDLIWEDKQWGFWDKNFVQTFPSLKIASKKKGFDNKDGKFYELVCEYSDNDILTKFDGNGKIIQKWRKLKDTAIILPIHYNLYNNKPLQSIIDPHKLFEFYSENKYLNKEKL